MHTRPDILWVTMYSVIACSTMMMACTTPTPIVAVTHGTGDVGGGSLEDLSGDVEDELPPFRLPDGVPDSALDSPPDLNPDPQGDMQFGAPCLWDAECPSGWCVESLEGPVCSKPCDNGCPVGFTCSPAAQSDNATFLCLQPHARLCTPCVDAEDCVDSLLQSADLECRSLGLGAGSFCLLGCTTSMDCPIGQVCDSPDGRDSDESSVCVPSTGTCFCSAMAVHLGAWTQCQVSNAYGACDGQRTCTEDGLTQCSAEPPEPEICNGLDDDCDGAVDEGLPDADGDGLPDCLEPDDDGDGFPDIADNCPVTENPDQNDLDGDGAGDACDTDDDSDGVPDVADTCPTLPNPSQDDLDEDGIGDLCDPDVDGDAIEDSVDNCLGASNPLQTDCDGDGEGVPCDGDDDDDGIADTTDNCLCTSNPGQQDSDGDGIGDPCDIEECDGEDNDGDGLVDEGFPNGDDDDLADCVDPCPASAQNDWDGDNICGDEDNCPYAPNPDQTDGDGDGQGDSCETAPILSDWPTKLGGVRHGSYVDGEILFPDFHHSWTWEFAGGNVRDPAVADGLVHLVEGLDLTTLDAELGEPLWVYPFPNGDISGPTVDGGYVYVTKCHGSDTGMYKLDSLTGQLIASVELNAQWDFLDSPIVVDGVLYTNGGTYGGLYAIDTSTLEVLWWIGLPQEDGWSPGYRDGLVYSLIGGWSSSTLYAHFPEDGSLSWKIQSPTLPADGSPWLHSTVVLGDTRILALTSDILSAIRYDEHDIAWSFSPGTGVDDEPAVEGGEVWVVADGDLYALDEASGALLWQESVDDEGGFHWGPALTEDHVAASTLDGLRIYHRTSTSLRWFAPTPGRPIFSMDGLFVVGDGVVNRFELLD